jgi:CheY-like chemotaxis protein
MDISMPEMSGIEAIRRIVVRPPDDATTTVKPAAETTCTKTRPPDGPSFRTLAVIMPSQRAA